MICKFGWSRPIVRYCVAACLGLLLSVGCSGHGSPTSPDLSVSGREGNPVENVTSETGELGSGLEGRAPVYDGPEYAPNEVLVVLHEQAAQSGIDPLLGRFPLTRGKTVNCRWATVYQLLITDGTGVGDMVNRCKSDPDVWIAEPNYTFSIAEAPYFPNDPLWESDDPGDDPRDYYWEQWGPAKLGASIVWNEFKGSSEVVVAVIDTGTRRDHEDLFDILWVNEDEIPGNGVDDDDNGYIDDTWGWDLDENDNNPWDDGSFSNHGTACAGVIGAIQDNGKGVTGIAPGVKIITLKISYAGEYFLEVVEGIAYAVDNGADIISMSLADPSYSEILELTCDDAWNDGLGVNMLGAAHNYNETVPWYPAAYESVMGVAATIPFTYSGDPMDEKRITKYEDDYYWGSNHGDWISISGYGEHYFTTKATCSSCYYDGTSGTFGGTSCATPMSSGVMALLHSAIPGQTGQWYWDRLQDTADDLHEPGFDIDTGYGRCNAFRAVYGSDRYSDMEDPLGFVPLDLPQQQVFDSIHDVPGNPFYDVDDLYRFEVIEGGELSIYLDIYTWGEDLDLRLYSDPEMTNQVGVSLGPNHHDSSYEEMTLPVSAGEEYFLRVLSPGAGNSTTYDLNVRNTYNYLTITGESLAPEFIVSEMQNVPFMKLTLETGNSSTLEELIISKSGTLPNHILSRIKLYRDNNSNGEFDIDDQLVAEEITDATNRFRLDAGNISWDNESQLVLFVVANVGTITGEHTLRLSLESYKDVTTVEGVSADYAEFPIQSSFAAVGEDINPPKWMITIGAQTAEAGHMSATVGWNEAVDFKAPPTIYNIYYTEELPFVIEDAVKLADVDPVPGITTDFMYTISPLPVDIEQHFVVRAEDQVGNEDNNLYVESCTPFIVSDPENPEVLESYYIGIVEGVAINHNRVVIPRGTAGIRMFDRTDPINLVEGGSWYINYIYDVVCDDTYAYCAGQVHFTIMDLSDVDTFVITDYYEYQDGTRLAKDGDWVYPVTIPFEVVPLNVSDPYDIVAYPWYQGTSFGEFYNAVVNGSELYVVHNGLGITVLDRSDPSSLSYVNLFAHSDTSGIAIGNDLLFVTQWWEGGIYIYDIGSNPADPPLIGSTTDGPGFESSNLILKDDYVYVACESYGLVVFDVTNPTAPEHIGSLTMFEAFDLVTDGTYIYVVTRTGYLYVVV